MDLTLVKIKAGLNKMIAIIMILWYLMQILKTKITNSPQVNYLLLKMEKVKTEGLIYKTGIQMTSLSRISIHSLILMIILMTRIFNQMFRVRLIAIKNLIKLLKRPFLILMKMRVMGKLIARLESTMHDLRSLLKLQLDSLWQIKKLRILSFRMNLNTTERWLRMLSATKSLSEAL